MGLGKQTQVMGWGQELFRFPSKSVEPGRCTWCDSDGPWPRWDVSGDAQQALTPPCSMLRCVGSRNVGILLRLRSGPWAPLQPKCWDRAWLQREPVCAKRAGGLGWPALGGAPPRQVCDTLCLLQHPWTPAQPGSAASSGAFLAKLLSAPPGHVSGQMGHARPGGAGGPSCHRCSRGLLLRDPRLLVDPLPQ